MRKSEYKPKSDPDYRPNTRKLFEEHHGIKLPKTLAVHHIIPPRLGGSHSVSNLVALTRDEHIEAHLKLYECFGDVRDLCASYMLKGLSAEARKVAAAAGGRAGHLAAKARGQILGFGALTVERRKEISSIAGAIGGAVGRDRGTGIHAQTPEQNAAIARLGGLKSCDTNGWRDPLVQSENGKRGGVKNTGFKWYHDGSQARKYTAAMQLVEPFDDFLSRTGFKEGSQRNGKVPWKVPKLFIVTHPDGREEKIAGMSAFCREHSLCPQNMFGVITGRQSNHKGFGCRRAA